MTIRKVILDVNHLDDGSAVVNFDMLDEYKDVVAVAGYVKVSAYEEDKMFIVTVVNAEGDVKNEIHIPFKFVAVEDAIK
jgi:hypothetical protein